MMVKLVFDSCSLIYLAKINQLSILKKISSELYIDEEVFKESVVSGKTHGYRDSFILDRFINDYFKITHQDISKEIEYFGAKGETSTYLLGRDGICITSDRKAFQKMLKRGSNVIKIEDLLYIYVKKQKITAKKFIQLLNELLKIDAISPEKYHVLMEEIKK
jgi:predicted nucleic acid-binding protein